MIRRELMPVASAICVTGPLDLVNAPLVRQLLQLHKRVEWLEFAATCAMLAPVVCLHAIRYQLSQLRCVDCVLSSSEGLRSARILRLPAASTVALNSVPDDDFHPATPGTESLAADRPQPLVLLTGCFDLIHAGHMRLIELASQFGARPVVAALTTKGIRTQPKNVAGDRPFWSMTDRLIVLTELRSNPRVMFFDGPDCLELIERLRPDVFVKEQRDRSREIVQREARLVEQLGGRVVWMKNDRFGNSSSTEIAKAIAASRQTFSEVRHGD